MNEHDFTVWAAGFFDGEGNVYIRKRVRGACTSHDVAVQVTQKQRRPLDLLAARWGGSISPTKTPSGCWRWRTAGGAAEAFMRSIRPWVVVKAEALDIGLALRETIRPRGSGAVSPEVQALREELRERLKAANGRA